MKLLENGIESAQGLQFGGWKWAKATYAFTSDDDEANEANRQFAKMMHVKTQYDGPPPTLTLGTILCAESTYWICLQPKCDSVRIYGPTAFPMLPMTTVTDHRMNFEIVVPHGDSWVLLSVPHKPALAFLKRVWPLDEMPSEDRRFNSATADIATHMRFGDWDVAHLLMERLHLAQGPDDEFLRFLEAVVHPLVVPDESEALTLVTAINGSLERDGFHLVETDRISGKPSYSARPVNFARAAALRRENTWWVPFEVRRGSSISLA